MIMMTKQNETVRYLNEQSLHTLPEWSEPDCYDLQTASDRRQMYGREVIQLAQKHGRVHDIAHELFEMRHPDQANNDQAREKFTEPIISEGDRYGKWFYFPWSNRLVQYPDEDDLRDLLTFRNQYLITAEEQRKLGQKVIAYAGLSVGMKVLEDTVRTGMARKIVIADPDVVSIMNLNRLNATMSEVGMRKTDVAGIRVSELNPYIQQVHFREGVTPTNIHAIGQQHRADLIYEHVDHLPTKIMLRKTARDELIPLVMATDIGDKSLIDVERYDEGQETMFQNRLTDTEIDLLEKGRLSPQQTQEMIVKIIGHENISRRMASSLGHIGLTLGGIAQLATTASAGAAYAAVAGREILTNRGLASGRYVITPQDILKIRYI